MTLADVLAHPACRGLSVGKCLAGLEWEDSPTSEFENAHAHHSRTNDVHHRYHGLICVRWARKLGSDEQVSRTVIHELCHLISRSGHDDRWRRVMRQFGQPIPKRYQKRPRPRRV